MANDETSGKPGVAAVVPFPFSRVTPVTTTPPDTTVCYGKMALSLGIPLEQTTGHWCSRCAKIWYGYLLEVACPTCGNRHG